eukprot:1045334-Amphidinium_carterae.1
MAHLTHANGHDAPLRGPTQSRRASEGKNRSKILWRFDSILLLQISFGCIYTLVLVEVDPGRGMPNE